VPQSVPLVPANITDPITSSKFLKDLEKLISLKSGRLANWNQQELNALASDLGIASPRHVAPHLTTTRPVLEAQTIGGSPGIGGSVAQPAPVPEPGTLLIYAVALGGLVARARFVRRNAVA
jgi:hypothetical protein